MLSLKPTHRADENCVCARRRWQRPALALDSSTPTWSPSDSRLTVLPHSQWPSPAAAPADRVHSGAGRTPAESGGGVGRAPGPRPPRLLGQGPGAVRGRGRCRRGAGGGGRGRGDRGLGPAPEGPPPLSVRGAAEQQQQGQKVHPCDSHPAL